MSTGVIEQDDIEIETNEKDVEADNPFRVEVSERNPEPEVAARHSLFGWCQTKHHGYAFGAEVEPGLCPGTTPGDRHYRPMECGCGCHRGQEPSFRARPRSAMSSAEDLVKDLDDGEPGQD